MPLLFLKNLYWELLKLNHDISIDVCLACYNGEKYIGEQIGSILNQISDNSRLIVSDDGSTDATLSIVRAFEDSRIILLKGPGLGVVKNFEYLCNFSKGDVVFLSDQDDIWAENKVVRMCEELLNADLVVSNAFLLGDNQSLGVYEDLFSWRRPSPKIWRTIYKNGYVGCTMAFRKNLLPLALPFPSGIPMHDQWIGLIGICNGRTKIIEDKLIYFRRHSSNVTSFESRRSKFLIVRDRVFISFLIVLRISARRIAHFLNIK